MEPVKDAKYNKNQFVKDNLEKLGVNAVMNGVASSSDGRHSVRKDSRIADDIVWQSRIYRSTNSRPRKTASSRDVETIASLQMVTDFLNENLENALREIQKLL
jgi:hypothetical protein